MAGLEGPIAGTGTSIFEDTLCDAVSILSLFVSHPQLYQKDNFLLGSYYVPRTIANVKQTLTCLILNSTESLKKQQ